MVFNIARDFDRVYLGISLWQSVALMNSEQEKRNIESQDAREISGSFRCLTTLSVKKTTPDVQPEPPLEQRNPHLCVAEAGVLRLCGPADAGRRRCPLLQTVSSFPFLETWLFVPKSSGASLEREPDILYPNGLKTASGLCSHFKNEPIKRLTPGKCYFQN